MKTMNALFIVEGERSEPAFLKRMWKVFIDETN